MHRTNRVLSWGAASLVSLGLMSAPGAQAQEPVPPPVPGQPKSTKSANALILAVNATKRLSMEPKRPIRSAVNEKEDVARVQTLKDDPSSVLIIGLQAGSTKVRLTDINGVEESIDIIVERDIEQMRTVIKRAFPTATVEPIPTGTNTVVLVGNVAHAEEIEAIMRVAQGVLAMGGPSAATGQAGSGGGSGSITIVNALTVGGVRQVQLDVVIAAVNRTEMRNFGVNFTINGTTAFGGSLVGTLASLGQQAGGGVGGGGGGPVILGPQAFLQGLTPGPTSNLVFGVVPAQFNTFIQALRQEKLAKLLAEPRLVTLSGRPAFFNSGGQQALPVVSSAGGGGGVNAVGSELIPFGTQLQFLPIVLGNGKIYLDINTSVTSLNAANGFVNAGIVVQGRDQQIVQTSVMMEPGQTFAVGGLIQNQVSGNTSKVPFFGDLPFIGPAFSTIAYTDQESELVILVTPYLVDPMDCKQAPCKLPGFETRTPDDFELFLELILEAPRGQREVFPNKKYKPAYMNDATADKFPCGGGQCATGCGTAGCGTPACGVTPAPYVVPAAPSAPAGGVAAASSFDLPTLPVTTSTKYYTPTGARSDRP